MQLQQDAACVVGGVAAFEVCPELGCASILEQRLCPVGDVSASAEAARAVGQEQDAVFSLQGAITDTQVGDGVVGGCEPGVVEGQAVFGGTEDGGIPGLRDTQGAAVPQVEQHIFPGGAVNGNRQQGTCEIL